MTASAITYEGLEQLLLNWGFQLERTSPAPVFRHKSRDALVALPPYRPHEQVAAFHLIGIRKLLTERGIVPKEAFDRETEAARTS